MHVAACVCLCRTQGRACEVASLVASMKDVVNKSEAWEIMQFLMNQVNNYSSGDELMNGLLDCMAEIFQYCETENKQQFLVVMIPKLIELTKTNVDYSLKQVVAGPEYQNENGVERLTMDTKNMGKVQMSINSAGSAKSVKAIGGSFQGSASERCILTVVEKHQFPTFTGAAIPVKYTFKL